MKIAAVEAIPVSVTGDAALRRDGTATFDHVLVRVDTTGDVVGWGEIAPMPTWPRGLTQAACVSLVRDVLSPVVEGRRLAALNRTVDAMETALSDTPFPIAGVDVALHDALGRHLDLPVFDLLGGATSPDRRVALHASIPPGPVETVRDAALHVDETGTRDVKVKVGTGDLDADRRTVRAVADAVSNARIRVDANGAWSAAEAIPALRDLDAVANGLVYAEQPVGTEDRAGLRRVTDQVAVPVIADEACFSPADVATIAISRSGDGVSLKVAKAGGLVRAHQAAIVADSMGLAGVVGGMLELGVGTAANAHLALAAPGVHFPTGILAHEASTAFLANADDWTADGPEFVLPDAPGLGVTVDRDTVEQYRVD